MALDFNNKIPEWKNEGIEPTDELKEKGFTGGYKPPATVFNWFWSLVSKCITELQAKLKSHSDSTSNPHLVTKIQVGLGNVDNTSDKNKPVSNATQKVLDVITESIDDEISSRETADKILQQNINTKADANHSHTLSDETITGILPLSKGGTGATTVKQARLNLQLGTASTKNVVTAVESGNTNPVTSGAVYTAFSNRVVTSDRVLIDTTDDGEDITLTTELTDIHTVTDTQKLDDNTDLDNIFTSLRGNLNTRYFYGYNAINGPSKDEWYVLEVCGGPQIPINASIIVQKYISRNGIWYRTDKQDGSFNDWIKIGG